MGIHGVERELRETPGCTIDVSIAELVEKYGKNVIVVDGFNFYGLYLYPKFDWICGGFRELVQELREFVGAFERIGVKLVFFFVEGNLDEGADSCGTKSWRDRRSKFLEYTQEFYAKSSQWHKALHRIKRDREYYHTPLNALPVVLFALRHILNCEVHLVYAGDRNDAVASYCRDNNCLAVLAQDNFYIFYRIPGYLSLKELKFTKMTTIQYCPEAFARHRGLEGHLYPLFIKESSTPLTPEQKTMLFKIEEKLDECGGTEVVREKIEECLSGKRIEELVDLQDLNIENIPDTFSFLFEVLRYKLGFYYLSAYGPLKEWGLIKLQAQELYQSGQMSRSIEQILMSKKYYNDCILEDFVELPPSSEVFQFLRGKLYSILFHEEPERRVTSDDTNKSNNSETSGLRASNDSETVEIFQPGALGIWEKKLSKVIEQKEPHKRKMVLEWYACKGDRPRNVLVIVEPVNPTLHPGLLVLWNKNNLTLNITDRKWQLFVSCISDHLKWQLLCQLPPTLVVPTVVLYYLFRVVPLMFKKGSWNFLQTWEVEVFIAQAVMLSTIDANALSKIKIEKINPRVAILIAFFVHGCHHVRLLIEACGNPISEHDLSVFHFFDGKLFHSFYDRTEWRRNARNLCGRDASLIGLFDQMKRIIIPEN